MQETTFSQSLTPLAVHAREALVAQAWLLVIATYAVAVANGITSHTNCAKIAMSEWPAIISKNS